MDFDVAEPQQTNDRISINAHQEDALAHLECWLPHLQFDLHQRHLETSISQTHTVAVAQIEKGCLDNSFIETWVLASIPSISETLIIAVFREPPHAFIDFVAELDATSETADHIAHGYTSAVQHSVLLDRTINSFTLLGFQELWPQLRLQGQKTYLQHPVHPRTNTSTSHYSQGATPTSFQGLIVHFQNEPWAKQIAKAKDQHRFKLEALSRSKNTVADIALARRDENQTAIEQPDPQEDEQPTPFVPPPLMTSESINQEDLALLRSFKQGPTFQTFFLFTLFLVISGLVFWLS